MSRFSHAVLGVKTPDHREQRRTISTRGGGAVRADPSLRARVVVVVVLLLMMMMLFLLLMQYLLLMLLSCSCCCSCSCCYSASGGDEVEAVGDGSGACHPFSSSALTRFLTMAGVCSPLLRSQPGRLCHLRRLGCGCRSWRLRQCSTTLPVSGSTSGGSRSAAPPVDLRLCNRPPPRPQYE
jgi:hypothetical protein